MKIQHDLLAVQVKLAVEPNLKSDKKHQQEEAEGRLGEWKPQGPKADQKRV